jgi:hypothetical protein
MLRILFLVFVVLVIVEGAVRKWILPDFSTEVFVVKDIILLLVFAGYVGLYHRNFPRSADVVYWPAWAVFLLGYAAMAGFSFESIVGLRYYLAPLPLVFLVPELLRDTRDLDRIATWGVVVSVPIGLLATLQYFSPLDSPLNTYAWGGEGVASFGVEEEGLFSSLARPRVTGTFSYISTYASFLTAVWLLGWLALLHVTSARGRGFAAAALVLILFNMGMNGSRALLVIALVTGLPFAFAFFVRIGAMWSQWLIVGLFLVVVLAGATVFEPFALTAMRGDEEEALERIVGALLGPLNTLSRVNWLGEGIGSTFGGYEQIGRVGGEGFDEVNVDRVGIELGVLGYVVMLLIKVTMMLKALVVYRRATEMRLRHWALAAFLVQASTVWQIPFYNSVAAIYYFAAIGLIYWIDSQESRARAKARHPGGASAVPPLVQQRLRR